MPTLKISRAPMVPYTSVCFIPRLYKPSEIYDRYMIIVSPARSSPGLPFSSSSPLSSQDRGCGSRGASRHRLSARYNVAPRSPASPAHHSFTSEARYATSRRTSDQSWNAFTREAADFLGFSCLDFSLRMVFLSSIFFSKREER